MSSHFLLSFSLHFFCFYCLHSLQVTDCLLRLDSLSPFLPTLSLPLPSFLYTLHQGRREVPSQLARRAAARLGRVSSLLTNLYKPPIKEKPSFGLDNLLTLPGSQFLYGQPRSNEEAWKFWCVSGLGGRIFILGCHPSVKCGAGPNEASGPSSGRGIFNRNISQYLELSGDLPLSPKSFQLEK